MQSALETYIAEAKKKNATDQQIKDVLLKAEWTEKDINQAFSTTWENIPVPQPPPSSNIEMWTGFIYILFFISLAVAATSIGGILHVWVDNNFPTQLSSINSGMSYVNRSLFIAYIAAIVVSYPVFAVLAIYLKKLIIKHPHLSHLYSRKASIYTTLVITFIILLIHIILVLLDFLSGNFTRNTSGHLLVTLLVAGPIFIYFLLAILHDRKIF